MLQSPWNSSVHVVPKPNGKFRLTLDYRRLNKVCVPDNGPVPRVDDVLDDLGGKKYFSKLDLEKMLCWKDRTK